MNLSIKSLTSNIEQYLEICSHMWPYHGVPKNWQLLNIGLSHLSFKGASSQSIQVTTINMYLLIEKRCKVLL